MKPQMPWKKPEFSVYSFVRFVPNSDADAFYPEPFGNSIFAFKNLHVYRGT